MKNRWKDILALMLGIFIAILLLEIALHFFHPFGFRQKGNEIVLPANTSITYENKTIPKLDSIIIHSKNSLGFRGAELPKNIDNKIKIIAVGGSTTECFYLSDGKDWPTLLSNKLNQKSNDIWLNNAGLDGHSTFGHQILLKDYIVPLQPDVVLFLIGCNDVERADLNEFDHNNMQTNSSWKNYLINHSEIASLIVNIRRSILAKRKGLRHSTVDLNTVGEVDSVSQVSINELVASQNQFLNSYAARLKNLIKICKENNIKPIFITQPTLVGSGIDEVTKINLEKIKDCHPLGGKAYFERMEVYNNVTRKIAKEENIQLIDLAIKMPKSSALFYDCIHFTNEGAEAVSEIIFEEIFDRYTED